MYSHPHSCLLASVDVAYVTVVKGAYGQGCHHRVQHLGRESTSTTILAPRPPSAISSRLNPDLGVGTCSPIK